MATLSPTSRPPAHGLSPRVLLSALQTKHWLGLIFLGHILLATWYSFLIPPFEAHDEWAHFRHAAYIAENKSLPNPSQRLTTEFAFDEGNQPPLYYTLAALPMLLVDTRDGYHPAVNPYVGRGTGEGGVNFVIHDRQQERWPWRGTLLALHLGRLVSVLISTIGLWCTWLLMRLLSPGRDDVNLTAVAFQALTPQYVFLSATMTNDILLAAIETASLYMALRLVNDGLTSRRTLSLGLIVALALLTKYLALAMLPVALAALILAAWQRRPGSGQRPLAGQRLWLALLLGALPLILFGGWLLARNLLFTGQLLPRDPHAQASLLAGLTGAKPLNLDWGAIPFALRYAFDTFWVSFGWGNVGVSDGFYVVWLIVVVGGIIGWIQWLRTPATRPRRRFLIAATLLFIYVVAIVALPLLRELLHASRFLRGRYLLALLPLVAWGLAQGWRRLSGRFWPWTQKLLIVWPAGLTIALAPLLIIPTYAPPAARPASPTALPVNADYGGKARLLSVDLGSNPLAVPGKALAVTLAWEILGRTTEPYTLAIHLVGVDGQSYGNITTYPGNGNAATTVWQPGARFTETYWLIVHPQGVTPTVGQIKIALFRDDNKPHYLPVTDPHGASLGDAVTVGEMRIDHTPDSLPAPPAPSPLARVGNHMLITHARLPNYPQQPGWTFPVVVRGQALDGPASPVQLSLQLLDASGRWVTGSDGSPDNHLPPPYWRGGDRLQAVRWLTLPDDLPPGRYRLAIALYHPTQLWRLTAIDANGQPLPNNLLTLGEITVQPP